MPAPIGKMIFPGMLPSFLKILYYKMKGYKIGSHVKIGLLSIVDGKDVTLKSHSKIGMLSFISGKKIFMGERSKINMMVAIEVPDFHLDNDSIIMEQVIVGGMETSRSKLWVGKRVKIFPFSFLNPTEPITIEDDTGIGGSNYLFTHGSWQNVLDGFPISFGPIHIKKGVWFPWRVFVLPNVTVGEYSTIGAGSVINKSIPAYSLAAGSPAKVIKADGEHLKKYSNPEKNQIIENIFHDFVDFHNYKNNGAYRIEKRDSGFMVTDTTKANLIHYYPDLQGFSDAGVVVSFNTIDPLKRAALKNRSWFDLSAKEAMIATNDCGNEVKNFFSRYGIRFERLDHNP
jgi:acetyltransferase-like isoleucine patch superfamily enzyme